MSTSLRCIYPALWSHLYYCMNFDCDVRLTVAPSLAQYRICYVYVSRDSRHFACSSDCFFFVFSHVGIYTAHTGLHAPALEVPGYAPLCWPFYPKSLIYSPETFARVAIDMYRYFEQMTSWLHDRFGQNLSGVAISIIAVSLVPIITYYSSRYSFTKSLQKTGWIPCYGSMCNPLHRTHTYIRTWRGKTCVCFPVSFQKLTWTQKIASDIA